MFQTTRSTGTSAPKGVSMDIKFAIVTCSDTRTIEQDEAGSALVELIEGAGWYVVSHVVAWDDAREISDAIRAATDERGADIVLTCGGTGLSPAM